MAGFYMGYWLGLGVGIFAGVLVSRCAGWVKRR